MKKVLLTAVLVTGVSLMSGAQTVINNEKMSQDGTNVTVSFEVDTDKTDLPSNRKELILPYIYNGKDTLYLDALTVYGKGRFKRERQINAIKGDKDWDLAENQIMRKAGVFAYESQVPLKRWMKQANLAIRRQIIGCACENELADENIAQASLFEEPQWIRRIPAYTPATVTRSIDFSQDDMEIVFKVSSAEIDNSVFDNEITFKKILDVVDRIYSNPNSKIEKLHVAGYASPEGTQDFNSWLGINRAKALINYIIKARPQYGLTENDFEIQNGEENWIGLRRELVKSDMKESREVIEIIDDPTIPNERKKQMIKELDGGRVWRKMLDEIYPHLRCARYLVVYYDYTEDKLVEAVNKVNTLIEEGRYDEAHSLAISFKDDPRAAGTIGVTLMLQKKFEEAMPWLEKALEEGCGAARKNIDSIKAEYGWEEAQKKEIQEYLKKYE